MKNYRHSILEIFVLIVILVGFFQPNYIKTFPAGEAALKVFKATGPFLAYIMFFLKSRKFSKLTIFWIFFGIWLLMTTAINGSDVTDLLENLIGLIGMAVLFDTYREDKLFLERTIYYFLSVLIVVNFATIVVFPAGLYATGLIGETKENWFLGFKNTQIIYLLPFLALAEIHLRNKKNRIFTYAMYIISVLTILLIGSATSTIGVITFWMLCRIISSNRHSIIFTNKNYFILAILLFILIPVMRLQETFSYIIIQLLHKSVDFTGRTFIWDRTIQYIKAHPIVGWGYQSPEIRKIMYGANSIVNAHNQMLEYLFEGGIVLLILYLCILYAIAHHIDISSGDNKEIVSALFLSTQLLMISEVHVEISFSIVYFIMWHFNDLEDLPIGHTEEELQNAQLRS